MKRRRLIALVLLVVVGAGVAAVGHSVVEAQESSATTASIASTPTKRHARPRKHPLRLAERQTGRLQSPVQDAAAAPLAGGRTILLGGLTAADTSRADVRIVSATGDRAVGLLPAAVHDAAAVRLGRAVYLFGGGTNEGTQSDAIVRVDASGSESGVGRPPAAGSDQAAAAVRGTAYVVGGPAGLAAARSDLAAVAVAGARILLAGGRGRDGALAGLSELVASRSSPQVGRATAIRNVYAFDGVNRLRGAARLARPLVYV